jgi:hypothetical protein
VQYLLVSDTDGRILRIESGDTFDGEAISRIFTLPWLSAGAPHPVCSWRKLRVSYGHQTSGTLTIQARVAQHPENFDAAAYTTIGTIDMSASTEYGWMRIALRSPWMQLRFTTTAHVNLYWPIAIQGQVLGRTF